LRLKFERHCKSIIEMLLWKRQDTPSPAPLGMSGYLFSFFYFHIFKASIRSESLEESAGSCSAFLNGHSSGAVFKRRPRRQPPADEPDFAGKFGLRLQGHPHREFLPISRQVPPLPGSGLSLGLLVHGVSRFVSHKETSTWARPPPGTRLSTKGELGSDCVYRKEKLAIC